METAEKSSCPKWGKFLSEILPDKSSVDLLRNYLYAAVNKVTNDKMLVLLGSGGNGKSVISQLLPSVLGLDNVCNCEIKDLVHGRYKAYNIARIDGKIINICSEIPIKFAAELKGLISKEPILAINLRRDPFFAKNMPSIIAVVNELPICGDKPSFFRKLTIIPFDVVIKEQDRNPNLINELKEESAGILNWIKEYGN